MNDTVIDCKSLHKTFSQGDQADHGSGCKIYWIRVTRNGRHHELIKQPKARHDTDDC